MLVISCVDGVAEDLPCDDKIVAVTHSLNSFDDLTLIVLNNLDPLQALQFLSTGSCSLVRL
jgi:hypothetical protein